MINSFVNTLTFVTEFRFGNVDPDHFEQLAFACPNLQCLDLGGCTDCLRSLQGLHMIAQCCKSLCGLNLKSIPTKNVESHIKL